jgi:hypothetical protein
MEATMQAIISDARFFCAPSGIPRKPRDFYEQSTLSEELV